MNVRLASLLLLSLVIASVANGQVCYKVDEDDCIEFESLFGYYNDAPCSREQCVMEDIWRTCPIDGEYDYDYQPNKTDFYYDVTGTEETGTTSISTTIGAVCVKRRPCQGCSNPYQSAPLGDCLLEANTIYTDFLWGSDITNTGEACGGNGY
jgi:hypothetical protein